MTWLPVFLGLLGMSLVRYGAGILWMAHYALDPASPRTGPTSDPVAPSGTAREAPAPRLADMADNYLRGSTRPQDGLRNSATVWDMATRLPRWSESAVLPGH